MGYSNARNETIKVLVIDDDVDLLELLKDFLQRVGYQPLTSQTGQDGLKQLLYERPNLVILDLGLPGMDGWKVCGRIRELSDVPVVMLTAKGETADRIRGLDSGADDYITKPFELQELLARLRAVLRRTSGWSLPRKVDVFDNGELRVDFDSHDVLVRGQQVHLTRREFRLLTCLIENPGRVLAPQQLLRMVWGPEFTEELGYVKLYIRYLRTKIEETPNRPRLILTERGVGYRFAQAE